MYTATYSLRSLSQTEFLALSDLAILKLGWKIDQLSADAIIAHALQSSLSADAKIEISIKNGQASLLSQLVTNESNPESEKELVLLLIDQLEQLRANHSPEQLGKHYAILQDRLVTVDVTSPSETNNKAKDFFQIFIPKAGYVFTPIIIDLNILIFILMVAQGADFMSPSNEILLQWGADYAPITLAGEWWRMFTSCFLHIGILHLFMNMYALLYIGVLLEPLLGKTRFLTAYVLSGLTGSLLSIWWHDNSVSAGASGAIFGMDGVFLALLTTNLIEKGVRKELLSSTVFFIGFNLVYGLTGNINNAAHIGGLLGGLVIGYAFVPSLKNRQNLKLKRITVGALTTLILGFIAIVYQTLPNDIGIYQKQMDRFSTLETEALHLYELPDESSEDQWLKATNEHGIQNWKACIHIIDGFDKLNLPQDIRKRNVLLKKYCELRLISFEFIYKGMLEDTDQYQNQITKNDERIDRILKLLNAE